VSFDEIGAKSLEVADSFSNLNCVRDATAVRKVWRSVIQHRAGGENLWTKSRASVDAFAQGQDALGPRT
jgi:hypothetical protein